MSEDDQRHGTATGYKNHGCRCSRCCEAYSRYNKTRGYLAATGRPLRVSALGTQRRIRALMRLGYGLPTLAAELNIATGNLSYKMQQPYVARRTHEAVIDLFDRLATLPTPEGWVAQRTRNIATRNDWPPPAAWDDIDDPDERPLSTRERGNYAAAELVAEWDHLRRAGESIERAAARLGVGVEAIEKAIERVSKKEVA